MRTADHIDRFKIVRELGKGNGVVVYLAEDPGLQRPVAIKTITRALSPEQGDQLIEEARIISKLRHPNIVSVYEVGEFAGKPYVLLEYVEGMPLRDLMKREGIIAINKAVPLMIQILDGIAHGHDMGIVHRDLSPSNIMIDQNDVPRIMDFGLSVIIGTVPEVAGTPRYMSPEHFSQQPLTPQTDIFSLGLLFYEMIAGHPAFSEGDSPYSLMYQIANNPVVPPSHYNKAIDHDLDRIILKALEKKPADRHPDAREMKKLLEIYLIPGEQSERRGEEHKASEMHGTVEFLMRRMRRKGDLPAFSNHMIEINNKLSSLTAMNFTSAGDLAKVILKDFSLTNKLLRIVNSAMYGNLSGRVTTVSKALFILGFDKVRMMAAALMIFDHLQNKAQAAELKEAALRSFMSGLIAMEVAETMKLGGKEEAFICAMLYNLGKMLVICYLPEEHEEIRNRMIQKGFSEDHAAKSILGITFNELGIAVSRSWNFPDKIVQSMESLPPGIVGIPRTEQEILQNLSNYSNELLNSVMNDKDTNRAEMLSQMTKRYQKSIPLPGEQVESLIESATTKIDPFYDIVMVDRKNSPLMKKLLQTQEDQLLKQHRGKAKSPSRREVFPPDDSLDASPSTDNSRKQQINILTNGIREITEVMKDNSKLSDVMYTIIETMYRGFEFNRVIFCARDASEGKMVASFGLGANVEEFVKHFRFLIGQSTDIFNIAISQGKGITIDDAAVPNISKNLPLWYRKLIAAPSFLIYPLVIKGVCIGMFYADKKEKGVLLTEVQRNYMESLRDMAIRAITQKHP